MGNHEHACLLERRTAHGVCGTRCAVPWAVGCGLASPRSAAKLRMHAPWLWPVGSPCGPLCLWRLRKNNSTTLGSAPHDRTVGRRAPQRPAPSAHPAARATCPLTAHGGRGRGRPCRSDLIRLSSLARSGPVQTQTPAVRASSSSTQVRARAHTPHATYLLVLS
eukprot:scaffold7738_cov107-Isochrysis_galbana.AAC.25